MEVEAKLTPPAASSGNNSVESKSFISTTRCDSLSGLIHPNTQRALLEGFRFEYLTDIQAETIPLSINGKKDIFGKAKTGTGKTLAFMIPAVESVLSTNFGSSGKINTIVISPTRELALQIKNETEKLLKFHDRKTVPRLECVIGGTKKTRDLRVLSRNNQVDILVATPGRLLDHLETTPGFKERVSGLRNLILDEADQLLDQGFQRDLDKILSHLPPKQRRRTVLFSATTPPNVQKLCKDIMNPDFDFVNTVKESATETNVQVKQEVCTVPFDDHLHALNHLIEDGMQEKNFKIIVFSTTARLCGLNAEIFRRRNLPGATVLEIHSRKSQGHRTKASDAFRTKKNVILFTSDVSARGVDYPDVTMVVQVGLVERATYIHRLGRTARAGKQGRGVLLLCDFESRATMKNMKGLPLEPLRLNVRRSDALVRGLEQMSSEAKRNWNSPAAICYKQSYQAFLGFYNSNLRKLGWKPTDLVTCANRLASHVLLSPRQPALLRRTVGKMHLKGTPGLLVE